MHPSLITTSQRTTIMRKSCLRNQFPAGVLNFDKQDEEIKLYKQDDKKDISQRTAIMVKHNHVEKKHKNRWPAGVLKLDKKDDTKDISEIGMIASDIDRRRGCTACQGRPYIEIGSGIGVMATTAVGLAAEKQQKEQQKETQMERAAEGATGVVAAEGAAAEQIQT